MKKITLSLVFLLTMVMGSYAQVTVGEGTNTAQIAPFNAYYGYTYSQSIYLGSEINASGTITSIQWYYNGTGTMPNSQGLTIYMGLTDKTEFESNLDYVSVQDLTAVYTGGIVTGGTAGWKTITFTTPFVYDGTSNLIVAVDENMSGYDSSSDKFRNSPVGSNRTIYAYSDGTNYDPADPTNDFNGFGTRGMVAFVPNIIFGGITQACATPIGLTTAGVLNTQATINWPAQGNSSWEIYIVEQTMPAPTASTSGVLVTGTPTYLKTDLTQNTAYSAYVRLKCSETLFSAWSNPVNFITSCDALTVPFTENFNTDSTTLNCWKVIDGNADGDLWGLYTSSPIEGDRSAVMYTDGNQGGNNDWLILPHITLTGTQQLSFKYKVQSNTEPNDLRIVLSTTGSEQADFTNVVMPLTSFSNTTAAKKVVSLAGYTGDVFIAFHVPAGGLDGWRLYIDEVEVDEVPSTPPGCIEDMNVVINEGCGNFPTVMTWAAVQGADGYKISIGTAPNGQDLIVNDLNVESALTYSFVGNPATTYYYTVKPYNANGSATGCFEDTFTTFEDGCYCISAPTSNDGAGISGVQINDSNTDVTDVTYADFTENGAIDITQGVNTIMNITLATGYAYYTNIWIDYNDNYTFEPNEIVFTGQAPSSVVPTVHNTSFFTPLTADLGEHRMRIVSTYSSQNPANPCYSGSWGVTLDFLVNVIEAPDCLPPSASSVSDITANGATLNWVSTGSLFNVEVVYGGESQGSGEVVTGVAGLTLPVTNLDAQTDYSYYIQTDCGSGSLSPWTGPFNFRTACDAFGDFTEDFTTEQNMPAPECWYTLKSTTSQYANVMVYSYSDYVQLYNSDDANAALYLITPALTDLPLNTHRVKFKAYSYTQGVSIIVGTMSDPSNASTFTAVQTIPMTDSFMEYAVSFANSTTDTHVAFKFVGTGTYQYLYIDDVVWEPAPTTAPACLTDINVETDSSCGNFATAITWTPVEGADFYTVTVGTTAGEGTPVNVGNVSSYDFVGNFATTYFYTVIPGNAFGNAVECTGGTFTTADAGCYCESIPNADFIDGDGITSLTVGENTFEIPLATYVDLTTDSAVVINQNDSVDFSITFETGYTYDSHIWIDWNDDYTFDSSEKVYTGVSGNAVPFELSSTFMTPADATLGVHRMRIGTADSGQFTPNPCYNGYYGITIDLNVDVTSLGVADFDNQSFTAYPNPVKDVLNINYTQNITDVTVYNILGQQVLFKNMNTNKPQLDMTSLATGTYLVKVKTENAVKTIKVVKE
ncbi:choice-of-anchor J domain-containing protein [Flavobacterium sp.]|uniref:T9SS-dependent choice-of-anchor J family protein n=1 Tax=Flavobacterium sp. TaxID=239 RepID=UPI002638F0DE|nr:choice-of-anchor J domain-containing protein [Flavobacterium sp.]MDD3003966.1 choice-of-anchor J domain-containing protein [Flavobacterium sp.]